MSGIHNIISELIKLSKNPWAVSFYSFDFIFLMTLSLSCRDLYHVMFKFIKNYELL